MFSIRKIRISWNWRGLGLSMKMISFLWIFFLGITCSNQVFAVKCYICGDEEQSVIECGNPLVEGAKSAGRDTKCHEICKDCVINQVKSKLGEGHDFQEGLPCYGDNAQCKKKYELDAVRKVLQGTDALKNLDTSLRAQEACGSDPSMSKRGEGDSKATQVDPGQELQNEIQEAFNLECPGISEHPMAKNTGVRVPGILAPIEGCNAASCDVCNARFCYLCLKPEPDSKAAHAHARAHSDNYWENRDGHTGLVPDRTRGQDYVEFEEYQRKRKVTIAGSTGNHEGTTTVIEKGKPYTYTDRYHWEIVREKLEDLFQSRKIKPNQEAENRLERLLKEKKMWPFPVGKKLKEWVPEVSDYFTNEMEKVKNATLSSAERSKKLDLLKRNWVALLQNEYIFQNRIAKHENSNEELKQAAKNRAETLIGVLHSLKARVLASLDASKGKGGGSNPNLTPLLADHEDERIQNLFHHLQQSSPHFFGLGGQDGRIYRITDPEGRVPPFVLSDSLRDRNGQTLKMTYTQAMMACPEGSQPPNKGHFLALMRVMSPGGRYNRNAIPGMAEGDLWSSWLSNPQYLHVAAYFDPDEGNLYQKPLDFRAIVRCVRNAE